MSFQLKLKNKYILVSKYAYVKWVNDMLSCGRSQTKMLGKFNRPNIYFLQQLEWQGWSQSQRPDDLDGEIYVLHAGLTGLMSLWNPTSFRCRKVTKGAENVILGLPNYGGKWKNFRNVRNLKSTWLIYWLVCRSMNISKMLR